MTYSDNLLAMQEKMAKSQLLHSEDWNDFAEELKLHLLEEQEWKAKIALAHSAECVRKTLTENTRYTPKGIENYLEYEGLVP